MLMGLLCLFCEFSNLITPTHLHTHTPPSLPIDQGECCCASTRTFVHEKIYDKFVAAAVKLANERKVGDAFAAGTRQGSCHSVTDIFALSLLL